jgi:hypothetical protein
MNGYFLKKLCSVFNLLFIVIFSSKNNLQKQTIIFDFRLFQHMNNCEFKEIVVSKDFEFENGVLGLERDVYLSVVKFLDSPFVRKV